LRDPAVTPSTDFSQFARLTELAAVRRYGLESREWRAVRESWAQVGVEGRRNERPLPWPLTGERREAMREETSRESVGREAASN
jgi:hypothetical protein